MKSQQKAMATNQKHQMNFSEKIFGMLRRVIQHCTQKGRHSRNGRATRRYQNLLVDTNCLIECHPPKELDWSYWKNFDEVRLIICRQVQRELDDMKHWNNRKGRRAKKICSLLRPLVTGKDSFLVIQKSSPMVTLTLDMLLRPTGRFKEQLDFNRADDEIIGCLDTLRACDPGGSARLLTRDVGPMGTAKSFGLPFTEAPKSWVIDSAPSEEEKLIKKLETDLKRLRSQEPKFETVFIDGTDNRLERLEVDFPVFEALSETEIDELIVMLERTIPASRLLASIDNADYEIRSETVNGRFNRVFRPPSESDIETFQNETYPLWMDKCRERFRTLHEALKAKSHLPEFQFITRNMSTRPARKVLLSIKAQGSFLIGLREAEPSSDSEAEEVSQHIMLPPPPSPPQWKWMLQIKADQALDSDESPKEQSVDLSNISDSLAQQLRAIGKLGRSNPHNLQLSDYPLSPTIPDLRQHQREPDEFYWKPRRPEYPVTTFQFECEQWRHAVEPEEFGGILHFSADVGTIKGALQLTVHAENLSDPHQRTIPVVINIAKASVRPKAEALISDLEEAVFKGAG